MAPVGTENQVIEESPSSPLRSIGVLLVLFGGLLGLHEFGLLPSPLLFWPLLLVYAGVRGFRHTEGSPRTICAVIGVAGIVLQFMVLSVVPSSEFGLLSPLLGPASLLSGATSLVLRILPVALIVVGLLVVSRARQAPGGSSTRAGSGINQMAIFGGIERRLPAGSFAGGQVTAVFGGVDLDLSACRLEGGEARLDAWCVFGGAEIRVPRDWEVVVGLLPIFGGCSVKDPDTEEGRPSGGRLILNGLALFGGVEVRRA
jgi:hypothetical protein